MKLYENASLPHAGEIIFSLQNPDSSRLAIVSRLGHSTYDNRPYVKPTNRVAIYDPPNKVPFAVFDESRYEIQHVAFHPTEPIMAIATGSFVGSFEGELITWNWETGSVFVLTKSAPYMHRVAFAKDGQSILGKMRYLEMDEYGGWNGNDTLCNLEVPYLNSVKCVPMTSEEIYRQISLQTPTQIDELVDSEFTPPVLSMQRLKGLFELTEFRMRDSILDIAILDNKEIAVQYHGTELDILTPDNGLTQFSLGKGEGVQLLKGEQLIINVCKCIENNTFKTILYKYDGEKINVTAEFDRKFKFSITGDGRVLGRQLSEGSTAIKSNLSEDIIGDESLKVWSSVDYGHFYPRLNDVNINYSPYLFLIQFAPSSLGPERKRLSLIEKDNSLRPLDLSFIEDKHINNNLSNCRFSYINDKNGEGVVISGMTNTWGMDGWSKVYLSEFPNVIFRKNINDGLEVWRHRLPSAVSVIHNLLKRKVILVSLSNKDNLVINSETGDIMHWNKVDFNRAQGIVTAIDSNDEIVAFGANDGMVATISADKIIQNGFPV